MFRQRVVAVVVPAFNEGDKIAATIRSVPGFVDQVIVVDDGSSDATAAIARRASRRAAGRGGRRVEVMVHGENRGVGAAIASGYARALALGADAIAVSNSAIQAIGCLGMRACHTDNCPVGIATQKPHLRARLPVDEAAHRLDRFFRASVELMSVLARACGHSHLSHLAPSDLTTFDRDMAHLTGIAYGGVVQP